ncbi:molybdopterin-dependent oxidoreductase [Calidifontibacillus oryziterrae]|uniref:molybdopterin-dependent oxidoreductase n=1 Tax=Calidifontibacillus oryziterrae TaxID=1191699 RepID=UPI0002F001ED|nr:molybdopterin-dependent oxidoreductase [Calidifontibacillus oryziterrae]
MGITRRTFLKASAVTGAAVAGIKTKEPLLKAFAENSNTKAESNGRWISTSCQGCTTWCPIQAYVEDNRVTKVRGNPNSKANEGNICPRPHLAIQQMYDPDRIKVPLKRTNPKKGRNEDPQFVPISWEEAIDTIADKLLELRKTNETHKFALLRGRYTGLTEILYKSFPSIFGSPNGISHSAICAEAEKFGPYYTEAFWDYRDYDLAQTRYALLWSTDPVASNRQVPHAINIWGQVMDQAKVAAIDPRLSATAAKADEWLPVIPGEDGALATAMAHVILKEGLWSREFVGDFVDGVNHFVPGQTVDETLFVENYTNGVVKWWNLELKDRTPEWAAERSGIPAEQITRVAKEFGAAAPRVISWVSPGTAMQIRGGYSCMAAHALNGLVGSVQNVGGTLGKMSVPKNSTPDYAPYQDKIAEEGYHQKKIDRRGTLELPALKSGKSGGGVVTNAVADSILEEDPYDLKVVIGYWNNWVFSCTGAQRWEKALEKLPFFAHITTNPAEMTQYADIVLPAAFHLFERWGVLDSKYNMHSYLTIQQPVVKPLWDVKIDETEIVWLLSEKLAEKGFPNLLNYYSNEFKDPETGKKPTTPEEFALYATKYYSHPAWDPTVEKKGDQLKGWDDFVEKGVYNSERYKYKAKWKDFGTKTGKFEFYSETLKAALEGHAEKHKVSVDQVMEETNYLARGEQAFIPHYEEPFRYGDEKEFPLIFTEHRSRLNREGRSQNVTWYQEFKDSDPGDEKWDDVLKLNPIDALKYGVKTGDKVKVTSVNASIEVKVKEWEGVRPGTAVKCYGQGHWAYGRTATLDYQKRMPRGGNNNEIHPSDFDRLSGATARHGGLTRIKIEKI